MSLSFLCGLFGYTRQAYYKHLRRNREGSLSDTLLLERVGYYRKLMPRLGGRKLWHLLQQDGFPVSRDRLFTLLSENNLLVKRRKKYSVTTCSRHWMRKYPNLIRGFDLERPHRLWVGDITYISLKEGFAYLALITDAYSKRIVGYDLNTTLERDGALRALRMAIDQTPQQKRQGLIHHSDRGCQYCSKEYVKLLTDNGNLSRPEKGLQKRVNLMQQKTNSDLSRHYLPRQLRHLILQEYLSGVKTARQLSEEHGIPMSTIHKMGQRWKAKNSCSFVSTPNPYPIMSRVTSEEASELLSENKALRRRLEEALLRLEGYEIMGDILQEEYGIDLLKKSAAGQSSVSKKDTQQ